MKILIVIVFITLFIIGFWYITKTSFREIQYNQSEINSKVSGLRLSVNSKKILVKELQKNLKEYQDTIDKWEPLKKRGIIDLHEYYDISDRQIAIKIEINKLEVEISTEKEMIKHYERFEK